MRMVIVGAVRPAYLTPKLTSANRLEIRRLRREDPQAWTLQKLADKFGVNRSTISHALRKRPRMNFDQELEDLRRATETSGTIETAQLLKLKQQEWNRMLLAEHDLGRQQQLVNLIKSVESMLDPEKLREQEYRHRTPTDEESIRRALEALDSDGKQTMQQLAPVAVSMA